ncbi:MAG: flippase [Deltaproteobacteria bacterium]|nr:flippase [Deltaproteobacteria bacterium]
MEYGAYRTIVAQSVFLGLLVIVVKGGGETHFIPVFLVYLGAHLCGFVYAVYVVLRKFVKPSKRIDVKLCKYLFVEAYPIALRRFIRRVNFRIDTILLNFLKGNIYAGLFHGAYKISQGLMFVGEALVVSVFPVLSRHYVRARESMDRLYDRSFRFLAISGGFLGVVLFTFSRELIRIILGKKYLQADYVVKIFAAMIVFMFLSKLAERMLIVGKRQLLVTGIAAVALFANVVFDLAFIPRWGTVGGAVATLLSEIILFALGLYYTYKHVSEVPGHVHILKVVLVFTVTCILVNLCVNYFGRPASYVCGPGVYIGAVMAMGLTPKDDLKELMMKLFTMVGVGPGAASNKDTIP